QLLERALASLADQTDALSRVFVVNNSQDPAVDRAASNAPLATDVLHPKCNLGTAGGIGFGMCHALDDTACTHVWVLDDDACATPGTLVAMLNALREADAECAAPLITDASGRVRWFPGPLSQPDWDLIRTGPTPEEFLAQCTNRSCSWRW